MKNYLVVGLGKFGKSVARTLYKHGYTVLGIDSTEDFVKQSLDEKIIDEGIIVDATDELVLKNLVKDDFKTAFVCIGSNIQASILVTMILKDLGVENIICKATNHIQGKVLERVGATQVIYPEESMGEKIALASIRPTVIEHFSFSDEYSIFEIKLPKNYIGKTLKELDLRGEYGANVMAIRYSDGTMNVTPNPDYILKDDDLLIILAKTDVIDQILKK